jgi:hypothetical protein
MQAHLMADQAFRCTAEIRELAVPAGTCSFVIGTTWLGAKHPTAEHTAVQVTLEAGGPIALRDLIDAAVPVALGGVSGVAA